MLVNMLVLALQPELAIRELPPTRFRRTLSQFFLAARIPAKGVQRVELVALYPVVCSLWSLTVQ